MEPPENCKQTGDKQYCHEITFPDEIIKGEIWKKSAVQAKGKPKAEPKTPKTIVDFFGDSPKPLATVDPDKVFEPVEGNSSPEEGFDRQPAPHGQLAHLTKGERVAFLPTGSAPSTKKGEEVRLPTQKERAEKDQRLIEKWRLTTGQ